MTENGHDPDSALRFRGDTEMPSLALAVILKYLTEGMPIMFSQEQLESVAGTGVTISWYEDRGVYVIRMVTAEEALEAMQDLPPNKGEMN